MTEAQEVILEKLPRHRVVKELETGALVVVFEYLRSTWMVVDTDGRVYDFRHYFLSVDRGS